MAHPEQPADAPGSTDEMTARAERARSRRQRIVAHVAHSFEEARRWDLAFWQQLTPQDRLSALVAIHRDIAAVKPGHKPPESRWRP
ncbi:MAG: hypothetical protein JXB32_19530 [Deltaproteobacteria bacterium]|nr:hypothetical protein [Deltaproteobacteria bacterium]